MHSQESIFQHALLVQSTLITKMPQLIQSIDFPTTPITEPLGQNYIKSIINNNLKTLDNNLTELQKYPNDSELASETVELYLQ